MSSEKLSPAIALIGERYQLLRPLARGGMGTVWVARHVQLDRLVAIKLLEDAGNGKEALVLAEARMLARLRHPNVVDVFDCGTDASGLSFIVMELLEGPTLAAHLDEHGPLGAAVATRLMLPVLDGLSAVHGAGLVHRDLKPENIVLAGPTSAPQPKLIDFGIARPSHSETLESSPCGVIVGTPQYMSPEQIQGVPGDIRSDVWGATAVLYEAIANRAAFPGEDAMQVFHAVTNDPPAFPAEVKDLDGRLWAILTRGLRKLPSERYATCAELATELRTWLSRSGSLQASMPSREPSPPAARAVSNSVEVPVQVVQLPTEPVEGPLDVLMRRKPPPR